MLDNNQLALLELLKASVFEIDPVFPPVIDWDAVVSEAKVQTVVSLAAKAVPAEHASQWQNYALQSQAQFVRVLHGQKQLVNLYEQAGIPLVILKGTAAAVYYPEPFRRMMGDVDFLVPQERFEEAVQLMRENEYHRLEVPNHRHIGFVKDGIEYELHHHFSYEDLVIEDKIINDLSHPEWYAIGEYRFPALSRLSNGLVLLAHLQHHMKSGVGLRQMIDWMMYVDKELDDEFWQREFRQVAESKGLATLAIAATRMCQRYLGLSERITWCASADDAICDQLLALLFACGNFGRKDSNLVESVSMLIRENGLFRYLQSSGEANWNAYHRHPILKPFCWIHQGLRVIRKTIHSRRGFKVIGDISQSKDRASLLQELGIT